MYNLKPDDEVSRIDLIRALISAVCDDTATLGSKFSSLFREEAILVVVVIDSVDLSLQPWPSFTNALSENLQVLVIVCVEAIIAE